MQFWPTAHTTNAATHCTGAAACATEHVERREWGYRTARMRANAARGAKRVAVNIGNLTIETADEHLIAYRKR
jgi:hypothetical protein